MTVTVTKELDSDGRAVNRKYPVEQWERVAVESGAELVPIEIVAGNAGATHVVVYNNGGHRLFLRRKEAAVEPI